MEEIWKSIKGFEDYEVSNSGKIKSLKRSVICGYGLRILEERILKHGISSAGYCGVILSKNGKKIYKTIHQLVAITFLNHRSNGHSIVVDHIDNNKLNNKVDNLQLVSNRENCSKDRKNKTSIHTGVSWNKQMNKWFSTIYINGKPKFLGLFNCEIEASNAYQKSK